MSKAMEASSSHEYSYAENSSFQNYNFHSLAKPRLQEAIRLLVSFTLHAPPPAVIHCSDDAAAGTGRTTFPGRRGTRLALVDFGCSYGHNTLDCMRFVLSTLLDCCSAAGQMELLIRSEIQYFFCDLPSNDFNALFQSLHQTLPHIRPDPQQLSLLPKVFTAGVPGSFYSRLFPSASLQLGICSYSLHWLSQIPASLTDRTSPAWNGGRTWMHRDTSPKSVVDAYAAQSRKDLKIFLKNRAHELASGGVLFIFSPTTSTPDKDDRLSDQQALDATARIVDLAWKELVAEGVITMEEMDMFNFPIYMFNQQELEYGLKDVPELKALHMETIKGVPMFWDVRDQSQIQVQKWLGAISSVMKPTLDDYLGQIRSNELLKRLQIVACMELDYFILPIAHDIVIATIVRL